MLQQQQHWQLEVGNLKMGHRSACPQAPDSTVKLHSGCGHWKSYDAEFADQLQYFPFKFFVWYSLDHDIGTY
jgi:hypothetical protein